MAEEQVVTTLISMIGDMLTYLMPIIGLLAGITFMLSFFIYVVFKSWRGIFKG